MLLQHCGYRQITRRRYDDGVGWLWPVGVHWRDSLTRCVHGTDCSVSHSINYRSASRCRSPAWSDLAKGPIGAPFYAVVSRVRL
jgi:hypothetical protein